VGTFTGANEAVLNPIFTQQMLKAGPAIVGMMIMFALIGVAIVTFFIDVPHIACRGRIYLDMFSLSHRCDQERARNERSGDEPDGRKDGGNTHGWTIL
jgi:hypothetical protein